MPAEGEATAIYLATDEAVSHISGGYFYKCRIAKSSKRSKSRKLAKRLYELSEERKNMDINILLALQEFRDGAGAFLAGFRSKMTWLGEINTVIVIMALIYWCVSKDFGTYILMGWSGNRLVNGMLKVTACRTARPARSRLKKEKLRHMTKRQLNRQKRSRRRVK